MKIIICLFLGLVCVNLAIAAQNAANYKSATRYNVAGQVTGTISPDPDGSGSLKFIATRTYYNNQGLVSKVETGYLNAWQSEAIAPASWSGFVRYTTVKYSYDSYRRKIREETLNSSNTKRSVKQFAYDSSDRLECDATRMNPNRFSSLPSSACTLGSQGSMGPDRITQYAYDSNGRVSSVKKAVGTSLEQTYVSYTYNEFWQQSRITDANGNVAYRAYDGLGRLYRWYFPNKQKGNGNYSSSDYEQYVYDNNHNQIRLRKRDGKIIYYTFDKLNRLIKKNLPNTSAYDVYHQYDLNGLMTSATFGSTSGRGLRIQYNGFGDVISETNNSSGTNYVVRYGRDKQGNQTSITYPDGKVFRYQFDKLGRSTHIKNASYQTLVSNVFDYNGQINRVNRTNNAYTRLYFDDVGRLDAKWHNLNGSSNDVRFDYAFNPAGQVTQLDISKSKYHFTQAVASANYQTNGLNQ